jgi:hypothetical protein
MEHTTLNTSSTLNEATENQNYSTLAAAKIAAELEAFKGGTKETAVSKFVASTLTHFCGQNARFAEVVYKTPRTLSDCCGEIMDGCGNAVSDIDVYRGAVQSYFPNSDVSFIMNIEINGDAPNDDEMNRAPKKKVTESKKSIPVAKTDTAPAANNNNRTKKSGKKEDSEQIQLTLFS